MTLHQSCRPTKSFVRSPDIKRNQCRLALQEVNSEDGGFRTPLPPDSLNSLSTVLFAHASEGFLIGTEGWVKFRIDDEGTSFHLQWVNPFLGEAGCSCRVEGTHADWYVWHSFSGSGNTAAHQRFLLGEKAEFLPRESYWRTCGKCKALFFALDEGMCAGAAFSPGVVDELGREVIFYGKHEAAGNTFQLPHNFVGQGDPGWFVNPGPNREVGWRKCGNCKALFYDEWDAKGVCPGRSDGHYAQVPGPNYLLAYNMSPRPQQQHEWHFCEDCFGLFFLPHNADGDCPAGGNHRAHPWNYVLDLA